MYERNWAITFFNLGALIVVGMMSLISTAITIATVAELFKGFNLVPIIGIPFGVGISICLWALTISAFTHTVDGESLLD